MSDKEEKSSGNVNISDIEDSETNVGNIVTGTTEGSIVARDKRIEAEMYIEHATFMNAPSEASTPEAEAPAPGESPFKGLQYFDVDDCNLFFGREDLTAELVAYLRKNRFLAVVGASGSGKSSLVRAGLIASLQGKAPLADDIQLPDWSQDWPIHIITPTAHPLKELAASLTYDSASVRATSVLMDDMAADPRSLDLAVYRILTKSPARRFLLVIDQFEELFTLCWDEAVRKAFVDNLVTAALEVQGPTTVVISLRADFYAHCAQYDQLRELLANHQKYIGRMNQDQLRQAIEKPAELENWSIEPGLVDLLLRDIGDEPGSLPLLSHALLETWKRRRGRILTLEGYAEAGGVHGAIAQTAENVYQQLSVKHQSVVRNIFLRLTELGEGIQDTRRRANLNELMPQPEARPNVETVLRILADARLVAIEREKVEMAHEALISEWPRLRQWLDENREGLRLHHRLARAAQEWERNNQDSSYLFRGSRLQGVAKWAETAENLNELERTFLQASLADQQRLERLRTADERARLVSEMALTLSSTLNYREVLRATMDSAFAAMAELGRWDDSTIGMVLLFEGDDGHLTVATGRNLSSEDQGLEVSSEDGLIGQTINTAEPAITHLAQNDKVITSFASTQGVRSAICVPLRVGFDTFGVILFCSTEPKFYSEDHKDFLATFAAQAIIALQNAQLFEDVHREQKKILEQESEARRKLARELHDGPTQSLAAIVMRLNFIRMVLQKQQYDIALDELVKVEEIARRATQDIRTMLFAMRPVILETQGLVQALNRFAERLNESEPFNVAVVNNGYDGKLNIEAEGIVFQIIEEAVGNAKKHANASDLRITLELVNDHLIVEIKDNGVGFDFDATVSSYDVRTSLGLINMDERAKLVGGQVSVKSAIGKGTTVKVEISLRQANVT